MKKGERRPNRFEVLDTHVILYIRSKGIELPCLVDVEVFPSIRPFTWSINKWGYAICHETRTIMARLIMNAPSHLQVDHIHHNRLDNRRSQLRLVTRSRNLHNYEKTPSNVYFHPQSGKWRVRFMIEWKTHSFGLFEDREIATGVAKDIRNRINAGEKVSSSGTGRFGR